MSAEMTCPLDGQPCIAITRGQCNTAEYCWMRKAQEDEERAEEEPKAMEGRG